MKDLLKNKLFIVTTLAVSFFATLVFIFGGHAAIKATSGANFCTACHAWMDPMGEAYANDVHGGNNAHGTQAKCVDCHLPQDSLAKYLVVKGVNGISEVASALFLDPEEMDWQEHREKRESFVYDSGCKSCHAKITTTQSQSEVAKRMHQKYVLYKDADKDPLKCVSCHKNVGHKRLSKILYDRTHEAVGEWPTDQ